LILEYHNQLNIALHYYNDFILPLPSLKDEVKILPLKDVFRVTLWYRIPYICARIYAIRRNNYSTTGGNHMSVAKVIEILAEGKTIEKAVEAAAEEASKTVRNVKNIYIEGIQAIVKDTEVVKYRVNAKITFVVD
jgi:flavin-binding protein dodecin